MDLAFEALNTNGKFQKILSVIIVMVGSFTQIISISMPFMAKQPVMLCREKDGDQLPFIACSEHLYCRGGKYEYQVDYVNSLNNLALSYQLYCERSYYMAVIGTAFFLGGIVGSIVLAPLPDTFGRKGLYQWLAIASVICQVNAFFCTGPLHYTITAFASGVIAYSYSMSMLLITEYLDRNTAGIIMSLNNAIFPASGVFVALIFLFVNSWRLMFFISIFGTGLILFLVTKYFVESPRWLNSKNRIVECIDTLKEIAKINGTLENLNKFLEENKTLITHSVSNLNEVKKPMTILDALKNKSIRSKILCLLFIWFASGVCFYGLILNIEHLGGNIYVDSILTFFAEMVAEMLSGWCADVYGRKIVLELGSIIGGISFILYDIMHNPSIKTVLIFLTSFGFSSTLNVIYIYSPEAMPTCVRSTVMGILYLTSRLGAMLVPSMLRLVNRPAIWFGILSLMSAYFTTFLEETLGAELVDDLPENNQSRKQSFFSSSRKLLGGNEKVRQTIVSDTYFRQNSDKFGSQFRSNSPKSKAGSK